MHDCLEPPHFAQDAFVRPLKRTSIVFPQITRYASAVLIGGSVNAPLGTFTLGAEEIPKLEALYRRYGVVPEKVDSDFGAA